MLAIHSWARGRSRPPPSTHRYGPANWHVRLATAVKSRCQTDAVISLVNDRRTPGKVCVRVDVAKESPTVQLTCCSGPARHIYRVEEATEVA